MKAFYTLFFFIFLFSCLHAQNVNFAPPVDIPLILNGNFGEIRSNHFHAGIDIKTNGETGIPVYAIEDGYVSRVAVSPLGYGNALYIIHPNGFTSVYAHLEKYDNAISEWVKKEQYKQKSFALNLYPKPNQFDFKKGDMIAYTGNSGSSAGPHLHFEIRKTETQNPVNPLLFKFDIKDNTKPVVENLYIYPVTDSSHIENSTNKKKYDLVFYNGAYRPKGKHTFEGYGKLGFGVDAIDYLDGNWSKCGIYQLEYWVDNQLLISFQIDELSYSNMRYINSHIDYEENIRNKSKFHKTYIEPGNKLSIYQQARNSGLFSFEDGKRHKVEIVIYDTNMNASKIEFSIKAGQPVKHKSEKTEAEFNYNTANHYKTDDIEISLPENALYTNIKFIYKKGKTPQGALSPLFRVHNKYTPLHKPAIISISAANLPRELRRKALIALFDIQTSELSSIGGEYNNGEVHTSTYKFGDMCIVADTIAPEIVPLSFKKGKLMEQNRIRFKITDKLSGIDSYEVFIDGKWILFEHDPKRDLIEYTFDEHLKAGKNHKLKLVVTDKKENKSTFETEFYY
ncbi:MAG: M23 family metallopeptidase [Prolixibacteraceae bacterium]|jgi:hypothetical protein|nr:M23 family metallopeptidase [Prolixibacteraceae bacterium]